MGWMTGQEVRFQVAMNFAFAAWILDAFDDGTCSHAYDGVNRISG